MLHFDAENVHTPLQCLMFSKKNKFFLETTSEHVSFFVFVKIHVKCCILMLKTSVIPCND